MTSYSARIAVAGFAAIALTLTGCASAAPGSSEPSSIFDDEPTDASTAPEETTTPEGEGAGPVDLSDVDACALLPKAEAEALAQVVFMEPTNFRDATQPGCQYDTDPYGDQPTAQVALGLGPGAKKYYDIDVELAHTFEDVPGLGDEAHVEDFAIFVRTGDLWFSITMVRLEDAALFKQGLIDAATAVAGRL